MRKSATDVMQEIMFSAAIDSIMSLKAASKGLPNVLLRDLNAIHTNTTLLDLPAELQATIAASVRAAFARLLKEGYAVSSSLPRSSAPGPNSHPPRGPTPGTGAGVQRERRPGGSPHRQPKPKGR